MTIDAVTLPSFSAGATLEEGQHFLIKGENFGLWPDEIVLGYDENEVVNADVPSRLFRLVSKTSTELDFVVQETHTYATAARVWSYFGSPFDSPRTLLEYETM